MTNDPTSAAIRKQINTMLKEQIEITRDGWWHPELGYSELVDAIEQAIVEAETRGRVDENDIWLAHSTARRLNDNEPAIRTVDFQDRKAELQANADGANGRGGEDTQ